jgi:hypothetical protein
MAFIVWIAHGDCLDGRWWPNESSETTWRLLQQNQAGVDKDPVERRTGCHAATLKGGAPRIRSRYRYLAAGTWASPTILLAARRQSHSYLDLVLASRLVGMTLVGGQKKPGTEMLASKALLYPGPEVLLGSCKSTMSQIANVESWTSCPRKRRQQLHHSSQSNHQQTLFSNQASPAAPEHGNSESQDRPLRRAGWLEPHQQTILEIGALVTLLGWSGRTLTGPGVLGPPPSASFSQFPRLVSVRSVAFYEYSCVSLFVLSSADNITE